MKSDDFDELTEELRDWDLDLTLLEPGKFYGSVLHCGVNGMIFGESRFNKATLKNGGSPPGMRSFVFPEKRQDKFHWRSHHLTGEHVVTMPGGTDFQGTAPKGMRNFNVAFPEEHLARLASEIGVPAPDDLLQEHDAFHCEPRLLSTITSDLKRLNASLKNNPEKIHDKSVQQFISRELPIRFLKLLSRNRTIRVTVNGRKRVRTLGLVKSLLEVAAPDEMTVQALMEATDVSERTLQYVFRDALGVTPHAYLKSLRLHGAYRDLKSASPLEVKIVDVANYWEFWHMGQFAADYRNLFSELPSQTLAKKK